MYGYIQHWPRSSDTRQTAWGRDKPPLCPRHVQARSVPLRIIASHAYIACFLLPCNVITIYGLASSPPWSWTRRPHPCDARTELPHVPGARRAHPRCAESELIRSLRNRTTHPRCRRHFVVFGVPFWFCRAMEPPNPWWLRGSHESFILKKRMEQTLPWWLHSS